MEKIKSLPDLTNYLSKTGKRKTVAVVNGTDISTQEAVIKAIEQGFARAIFAGGEKEMSLNPAFKDAQEHIQFLPADDRDDAARKAVALVKEGKADILMKGLINTDNLLRAILDKESGILPKGNVLTHMAAATLPAYPKLLFFTDAAVIPFPSSEQRIRQVKLAVRLCHSFGIERPKISLIHCSEKVNAKYFPYTAEYKDIIALANEGIFGACIVDGPLDVKTSCCKESLETKGITSPIDGEADVLVFPNIEAGNAFYKAASLFGKGEIAATLLGAQAPVVLTSRSDDALSKFYSLALAAIHGA